MNTIIHRLLPNEDLKEGIWKIAQLHHIKSGCVIACVGCLTKMTIRMAGGEVIYSEEKDREIVSLTGTIADNGMHLHISASDVEGNTIGGHLKEGCIIGTTAEVVILEMNEHPLHRKYDPMTGYQELVVE